MSKVLFFNIPAHGHTYPTLPLVDELVRRGEQVTYYSSPAFQQVIEQKGGLLASPCSGRNGTSIRHITQRA